jgi:hypothetical protein
MNLTPIPFGLLPSPLTQTFDHTTCALTVNEWSELGMLIVNATVSFRPRGLEQQINAPIILRFIVSPSSDPSAVIAETGHRTSARGYIRLSSPVIFCPLFLLALNSEWSRVEVVAEGWVIRICYILYFQPFRVIYKQNTCQAAEIKTRNCNFSLIPPRR